MMVKYLLMMVKCQSMMVKLVYDHIISPSLTFFPKYFVLQKKHRNIIQEKSSQSNFISKYMQHRLTPILKICEHRVVNFLLFFHKYSLILFFHRDYGPGRGGCSQFVIMPDFIPDQVRPCVIVLNKTNREIYYNFLSVLFLCVLS